jgi:hypothetical protein
MASTSTSIIPLAQFSPLQDGQSRHTTPENGHATAVATPDGDVEDVWRNAGTEAGVGEREQANLPKADSGKEAWLFLCGCFVIEALVWGRSDVLFVSVVH